MDIEKLRQRRRGLEAQHEQLAASLNSTVGALQMLDTLIAEEEAAALEGAKVPQEPA